MAGSGFLTTTQAVKQHLLTGGGIAAEVKDLRDDLVKELAATANICVDEWINPPAAAVAGLKAATATVAAVVVLTVTDLLLGGVLAFARQVTFTTAGVTPAHAPPNVTIEGTDVLGRFQSETLNLAQTAAMVSTVKAYKTVTKVRYPAADGTAATVAIGWDAPLGMSKAIKARAGLTQPIKEIVDGAVVSPPTGTFTDATTNPPYGLYTPATAADGAHDYALYFEGDSTIP